MGGCDAHAHVLTTSGALVDEVREVTTSVVWKRHNGGEAGDALGEEVLGDGLSDLERVLGRGEEVEEGSGLNILVVLVLADLAGEELDEVVGVVGPGDGRGLSCG